MKSAGKVIGKAAAAVVFFTLLCGLAYTLVLTGISQLAFPRQANGTVIEIGGRTYGSELLGQTFVGDEYLWGRIQNLDVGTFTDEEGNPAMYAWASNKTPAGEELGELVAARVTQIQKANPEMADQPIPVDLVTCSGSGQDPDISPAAAEYQVERIARVRNMAPRAVREIIARYTTGRFLGLFGEPRVNVLQVNLALDGILKEG